MIVTRVWIKGEDEENGHVFQALSMRSAAIRGFEKIRELAGTKYDNALATGVIVCVKTDGRHEYEEFEIKTEVQYVVTSMEERMIGEIPF